MPNEAEPAVAEGRLAQNLLYFGRALRAAGMVVGPGVMLDAAEAMRIAGLGSREDLYWTLHAVFVSRREDHEVFDQAFHLFWRRRSAGDKLMALLSPVAVPLAPPPPKPGLRRVEDAFFANGSASRPEAPAEVEVDARFTASDEDVLRTRDFAQMSTEELTQARRRIAALRMPDDLVPTRRLALDPRGRLVDLRAALRASLATGGAFIPLRRRGPVRRPPPVVALVDISGSMSDYARPVLHFLHALAVRRRVDTFLFGTRLTNVSRALRHRDVDAALAAVAELVPIGPAAPASPRRCGPSTRTGRAGCWGRIRWCCWSPTGWSAIPTRPSRAKWIACTAPAGVWCGLIRCCAMRRSSRAPGA